VAGRPARLRRRYACGSVVYRRRAARVNLFVWRASAPATSRSGAFEAGYSAYCWAKDGMHYLGSSDLNEAELQKFVELVRRQG